MAYGESNGHVCDGWRHVTPKGQTRDHNTGPLLFLLYTAELAELAARFGVTLHAFADDNQL